NGTPIHERSRNIDNRRSLGHWEGDLVSGTKNSHIGVLRRNRRNFRYPSFRPATNSSKSIISLLF
nr:hypothetical protein [Escherichia coli]